jgi:hypothetical protein
MGHMTASFGHRHLDSNPNLGFNIYMEDRPHKAHRPAQSGAKSDKKAKAKGKEKQQGFNAKVCKL